MLTLHPSHAAERAEQLRAEAGRERDARAAQQSRPAPGRLQALLSALRLTPRIQPA